MLLRICLGLRKEAAILPRSENICLLLEGELVSQSGREGDQLQLGIYKRFPLNPISLQVQKPLT